MPRVYLSLGSNIGDRKEFLTQAVSRLQDKAGVVTKKSLFYETESVGKIDQSWFFNCCLEIETKLKPKALLKICQETENTLSRERREKWGPRTIDIDILFYNDCVVDTTTLTIPHPEISKRRFVLVPLAEIAPDFRHPLLEKSINELLKECPDTSIVRALHGYPSTKKTSHAIPDRHPLGRS